MAGLLRGGGAGHKGKNNSLNFFLLTEKKYILLKTTYQNIITVDVGKVVVFYQVCCNI